MKKFSDSQFLPYFRKKIWHYILMAVISIGVVVFFNRELTDFFVSRSRERAIILFFLLPILTWLTRPYPYRTDQAVGFIYALREKEWKFFSRTLLYCLISPVGTFFLVLLFYYLEYYAILVGFSNWVYCFSFLALLFNLVPMPPPPIPRGTSILITICGPRSCGKTVFVGMLFDDIINNKSWMMAPSHDNAQRYIINVKEALAKHQWPEPTAPLIYEDKSAEFFTFYFTRKRGWYPYFGLRYFSIVVPDPAGELFENIENLEFNELPEHKQRFFQDMAQSAGALFIIDSQGDPSQVKKFLETTLKKLQVCCFPGNTGQKITFPIAIGVSKVDTIYAQYKQYKNRPKEFFITYFGPDIYRVLTDHIENFKIFYFSAIGVKKVNIRFVPRTHRENGQEVPDKKLRPFGLFKPLKWLLYQSSQYIAKEKIKQKLVSVFKR